MIAKHSTIALTVGRGWDKGDVIMNKSYRTMCRDLLDEANNKCELCGSRRNLEVHHLVPRVCAIDGLDIDDKDNLIVVCGACHAKLTNKGYLTKYGQRNKSNRAIQMAITDFYKRVATEEPTLASEVVEIFIEWAKHLT